MDVTYDYSRGGPNGRNVSPAWNKVRSLKSLPFVFVRSQKVATMCSEPLKDSMGSQLKMPYKKAAVNI